jgi:cytochrome c-type biogenesis protein CcmF
MEAITGEKETIDAPYYNRVNVPIGLFLLLLTGIGPLIAWRKSSLNSLKRAFLIPSIAGVVVMAGLFAAGIHQLAAVISLGLCAFVTATILIEFWKGAKAIEVKEHMPLPRAAVELTWRNTRRYGGYLVHMGIVLMFIGFTGRAFDLHETRSVGLNQTIRFGHYDLKLLSVTSGDNSNYESSRAVVDVSREGRVIDQLTPEIRLYKSSQEQSSMVGLRRRLN